MFLVGHEHVMKIPEFHITWIMALAGIVLLIAAFYCSKEQKCHILAYTVFP